MGKIIDKTFIYLLTLYVMDQTLSGTELIIVMYIALTLAAVNYYLLIRNRSDYSMKPEGVMEKTSFIITILGSIAIIVFPQSAAAIPNLLYDITKSRNYIALGLTVIGLILGFSCMSLAMFLLILLISAISIYLSIKSERGAVMSMNFHRLRDDSSEKSERLLSQNLRLEKAKDDEVYTAQLSERNRIAREIHDNVGHMLSRALLQTGAMLAIHKEEPVHTELADLRSTLDTAMNNIRSSVHDLHDESTDLPAAINQMAKLLRDSGRFKVNIEIDTENDMPRNIKYAVLGIAKECITNIHKHSSNPEVDIKVIEHPSMYQMVVHDYNPNNDTSSDKTVHGKDSGHYDSSSPDFSSEGIGLANIRSRVESLSGNLSITTNDGFRVFITIPISK